jgi:uncharacterized protein (TIGR02266 family)
MEPKRRQFSRIELQTKVKVTFSSSDSRRALLSTNLSEGGLFLQAEETKPVGTKIEFEFALRDGGPSILGHGVVRWIEDSPERRKGMGIKFLDLNDEGKREILEIIQMHQSRTLSKP